MFSLKARLWQAGLTLGLLVFTYGLSLSSVVAEFEFEFFSNLLALQPVSRKSAELALISNAPHWLLIVVYGLMMAFYVRKFTRSQTTALSILLVILLLFALLMLEVMLAIFFRYYLPIVFPALVMLLLSLGYWAVDSYRHLQIGLLSRNEIVALSEIQHQIDSGNLKTALIMLKQSPYSDDLLELGYELGMLLESGRHWASALNLYHWLSSYDPGLGDFVARIEEIRKNRGTVLELAAVVPSKENEYPTIGHFQLQKKIATGATAIVYHAFDLRTHNTVALKVMSSQSHEKIERERIEHWLHEAEIVARLDHRNIVKIHDAGKQGDSAYIAMDYISGYSMSQRLRKREYLTVGECIRISKAMLRALIMAHSHRVIHGDIKPANIMYDEKLDTYILTDFGAAYSEHTMRSGDNSIVGTPAYMSPEQLSGGKLDGRSDLFSLAVTLYHLFTGHQPFVGDNLPELKQSILHDEPDLNHLTMPAGIIEVIMKALQKKPYMRFADAQQMLTAVEFCESSLLERMNRNSNGSNHA